MNDVRRLAVTVAAALAIGLFWVRSLPTHNEEANPQQRLLTSVGISLDWGALTDDVRTLLEAPGLSVTALDSADHGVRAVCLRTASNDRVWLTASRDRFYAVGYLTDGRTFETGLSREGTTQTHWGTTQGGVRCLVRSRSTPVPSSPTAPWDDTKSIVTVDVLALYTTDALRIESGAWISDRVRESLRYANCAFARSQVAVRVRLVDVLAFPYEKKGSLEDFLATTLRPNATPEGQELWRLRRVHSADIAMVVVGEGSDDGLAHVASGVLPNWWPNATIAIPLTNGMPGPTTAHEIAHQLGAGHQLDGAPDGSYAHAFRWDKGRYYTIMATEGGRLVEMFSNPHLKDELGAAVGKANEADNVRAMNENRKTVADWAKTPSSRLNLPVPECNQP